MNPFTKAIDSPSDMNYRQTRVYKDLDCTNTITGQKLDAGKCLRSQNGLKIKGTPKHLLYTSRNNK